MAKIVIRDGEATDHPFVRETIKANLLTNSAYFARLPASVFGLLIDPMIATHKLFVAQPVDSPADIVGFLLGDPPSTVSFVYVRNGMRRGGVATALASVAGIERGEIATPFLTTKTNGEGSNFPRLAMSKGYKMRFRPFLPLEVAAALYTVTSA